MFIHDSAHQERHRDFGDLAGNLIALSVMPQTTKQFLVAEGVNYEILLQCIDLRT